MIGEQKKKKKYTCRIEYSTSSFLKSVRDKEFEQLEKLSPFKCSLFSKVLKCQLTGTRESSNVQVLINNIAVVKWHVYVKWHLVNIQSSEIEEKRISINS